MENIENIVIGEKREDSILGPLFFGLDENIDVEKIFFSGATNMQTLAYEIGAYKSKSEATRAGRCGEIPYGFNEIWINKKRKLWVYSPSIK